MQDIIERGTRRTRTYWYADGLTEMAVGVIFALISLLFLIEALAAAGPLSTGLSAVGLPVVVIGGSLLAQWAVKTAKERITYPRTGYVAYRETPRLGKGLAAGMGIVMAFSLVFLFKEAPASLAWIPTLIGILAGLFWFSMGYALDLLRFYCLAAVSLLAGLAGTLLLHGDVPGNALYFAVMALATFISGALTLRGYLAQNQPVADEDYGQ